MSTSFGGYMGKVVELDLTTQQAKEYPWTDDDRRLFVGGKIMAARILQSMLTGSESPFSEENPIIISTGPLTGTGVPSSFRFNSPRFPLRQVSLLHRIAAARSAIS